MAKRAERAALVQRQAPHQQRGRDRHAASRARARSCTSGGFAAASRGTYASIVVNPVADDEGGKKRSGYYWSARRHFGRARHARVGRRRGRAPHAAQARRAQARHAGGRGRLRPGRGALDPRAARGLRHGRRHLAQVELPRRARGHAVASDARHDRRRPAPAARARLAPVRRRGAARAPQRRRRRGRAEDLSCSTATAARKLEQAEHRAAPRAASGGGVGRVDHATSSSQPGTPQAPRSCSPTPSARSTSPT